MMLWENPMDNTLHATGRVNIKGIRESHSNLQGKTTCTIVAIDKEEIQRTLEEMGVTKKKDKKKPKEEELCTHCKTRKKEKIKKCYKDTTYQKNKF